MSTLATTRSWSEGRFGHAYWERFWYLSAIQFIGLFIVAFIIQGTQPAVGASPGDLSAYYDIRTAGIIVVVLALLGGTTWLSGGFWAPDGAYARFVSPTLLLVWVAVLSKVLLARPARTRGGW